MISKPLKSIKPARKVFHESGTAINAINCPATSSMTTNCGSFRPEDRATCVAAGMPVSVTSTARASATGVRSDGVRLWASADHNMTVVADAQLPGPGRTWPMPKNVAVNLAHRGVRGRDAPSASSGQAPATAGGTPALRSRGGVTSRPSDLRDRCLGLTRSYPSRATR